MVPQNASDRSRVAGLVTGSGWNRATPGVEVDKEILQRLDGEKRSIVGKGRDVEWISRGRVASIEITFHCLQGGNGEKYEGKRNSNARNE
jgi:hypothetical protein